MARLFRWNNVQNVAFLIVLGAQIEAFGADFNYFGTEIDYWHDKASKSMPSSPAQVPPKANPTPSVEGKFSWDKYMDPKNKEFFKEGDYTPPEPFMETVRNPSDDNLKMWFAYIDKKNELTRRLQERMEEYLAKNGPQIEASGRDTLKAKLASLPVTAPDAKRYRFRMYFDSHCPHCRKMFGTLSELQAQGFYVEAKQVDSDSRGMEGLNIPVTRATQNELKEKDVQSVPVLLVGDMKLKTVYRLTGYQTTANVFTAIGHANSQPAP